MQLGARTFAANDVRMLRVSYRDWLSRGASLASITVVDPTGSHTYNGSSLVTIGSPITSSFAFSPDRTEVSWLLTCPAINQTFTLQVQVTDTLGQLVNDTIAITIG